MGGWVFVGSGDSDPTRPFFLIAMAMVVMGVRRLYTVQWVRAVMKWLGGLCEKRRREGKGKGKGEGEGEGKWSFMNLRVLR